MDDFLSYQFFRHPQTFHHIYFLLLLFFFIVLVIIWKKTKANLFVYVVICISHYPKAHSNILGLRLTCCSISSTYNNAWYTENNQHLLDE